MTKVISTQRLHLTSREVQAEIAGLRPDAEISDGAALAIAASWQAPAQHGVVFAQLASVGFVDYEPLMNAIAAVYDEAKAQGPEAARELDLLATWAMNHPSRGVDKSAAFMAKDPIAPHLITIDRAVVVPRWVSGAVVGWCEGTVVLKQMVGEEMYFIVDTRFGKFGYYPYSIGHALESA